MLPALQELRACMERRNLTSSPSFFQVVASISNAARVLKDNPIRIQALQWLVGIYEHRGDGYNGLTALLGLAMAYGDAGDNENAEKTYQAAVSLAEKNGKPNDVSHAARNFGLYLSEKGKRREAGPYLERAVVAGRLAGDKVMLGRALVAQGIFVQHSGNLQEAKGILDEAVSLLPPTEADILYALSHLNAIEVGGSCGCGDMSGAFSGVLRMLVMKKAPPGFLKDIHITFSPSVPPDVKVNLTRQPTPQETEMLNRIIQQGLNLIRGAIARQGFSR